MHPSYQIPFIQKSKKERKSLRKNEKVKCGEGTIREKTRQAGAVEIISPNTKYRQ